MAWKTSYYHFDAVGSTRLLTDTNQNVRASYTQTAFGKQLTSSSSVANPFRFVGQLGYYFDAAIGLFNVRQRVYDATIGRWLSQDPAQSDQNPFRYVQNSPLRGHDPSGLVLIAFDGTDNKPSDQTNVTLFRDQYEGTVLYYSGVGTGPEAMVGSLFGATFAYRIEVAFGELDEYLQRTPSDRAIDIVGFSRGAALARVFANRIQSLLSQRNAHIRFIGVWDTVFALGVDAHVGAHLGIGGGTHGLNRGLPPSAAGRAYHAMSMNENRDVFALERYAGAREVWFPGVHADVGGGYDEGERGFGNVSINWMIHHARSKGVPVAPIPDQRALTLSNLYVHDEMSTSLVQWAGNFRRRRNIPAGDMIHISAVWARERRTMDAGLARVFFSVMYPDNILNDDDGFLERASRGKSPLIIPRAPHIPSIGDPSAGPLVKDPDKTLRAILRGRPPDLLDSFNR